MFRLFMEAVCILVYLIKTGWENRMGGTIGITVERFRGCHAYRCGLKGIPNMAWTSTGFSPCIAGLNFHCFKASRAR